MNFDITILYDLHIEKMLFAKGYNVLIYRFLLIHLQSSGNIEYIYLLTRFVWAGHIDWICDRFCRCDKQWYKMYESIY